MMAVCRCKLLAVLVNAGDQLLIGKETAKQLGMGTNMYTTELLLAVGGSLVLVHVTITLSIRSALKFFIIWSRSFAVTVLLVHANSCQPSEVQHQ
jgi:hypothetical protein